MAERLDLSQYTKTEQKYIPKALDGHGSLDNTLAHLKQGAVQRENVILSHPSEPYSARIYKQTTPQGDTNYKAALKTRGVETPTGVERIEFPVDNFDPKLYEFYNHDVPVIQKLRATPQRDIAIDYYPDNHILVESENPEAWRHFLDVHDLRDEDFVEATYDKELTDVEFLAHAVYKGRRGRWAGKPKPDLRAEDVLEESLRKRNGQPVVVTIGGRSGSGKTYFVEQIQQQLADHNRQHENDPVSSLVLSTDNYHRGKILLNKICGGIWDDWEADMVYDLQHFEYDLRRLIGGQTIQAWQHNFGEGEKSVVGAHSPADIILVEGIKANHPIFRALAHLSLEMSTPFATSCGRRVFRDIDEREDMRDPIFNTGYYYSKVEPAYLAIAA